MKLLPEIVKKLKQCEKMHRVAVSHRTVKRNPQKVFWYDLLYETCSSFIFPLSSSIFSLNNNQ